MGNQVKSNKVRMAEWRAKYPERDKASQHQRYLKYLAENRCPQCKQPNDSYPITICVACRAKKKELAQRRRSQEANKKRTRRRARREAILEHYGRCCVFCGSTESLELDHINNDGREHREQLGGASDRTYSWVIKNAFPATFQVLCQPCNYNKFRGSAQSLGPAT